MATHRTALEAAVAARQGLEQAFGEEERRVAGLQRAAADRREGMARLHGQVNGLRSRAAAAEDEIGRLTEARVAAVARADQAQHDFTSLESRVAGLDAGEEGLDAEHEGASCLLADIEDRLAKIREELTAADRERSSLAARKEALELGLNRKDGAGALLAATDSVSGLLGSVAALLSVRSGYEAAVAGALGSAADAVAVHDVDAAVGCHRAPQGQRPRSRRHPARRGWTSTTPPGPGLPVGAVYAMDVVECPADLRPALARLLFKVAVVDDLAAARTLVRDAPDVTAVTLDGDLLGAHFAAGGSSSQPSLIEVQAAVDDATEKLTASAHTLERLGFDAATLETEREDARRRVDVALAKLHESDATLAAVAEELGQFGSQARNARAEAARLDQAIEGARLARDKDLEGLAELEARLAAAEDAPEEEPDTTERERLGEESRSCPGHRDGGPARPADRRGACPRAARSRRLAGARPHARSVTPAPRRSPVASSWSTRAGWGRPSDAASPWCWPGSRSPSPSRRPSAPGSSRAGSGASRRCASPASSCATSAATSTSWSTPCTATRWRAPSSGCGSSSSRSGRWRSSAWTPTAWSPSTAPTS